ncbi:hypothetical protein [Streptomyces sp. NPDC002785]|uniref:hypothetical protein n=1 Tax=Streptomyces sp. NPDC002785 TaxID=3154543 RepID=UPI00331FC52E
MERLEAGDPERIGPYTLFGRLGSDGMGAVYAGRAADGRPVAVKVIRPALTEDQGILCL